MNQNAPIVGDINNDGEYEVLLQTNDRHVYCLLYNGLEAWRFRFGGQTPAVSEGGSALGDIDGDGDVDWIDFLAFVDAYTSESGDANYSVGMDFDDDEDVDAVDFGKFAAVYGTGV